MSLYRSAANSPISLRLQKLNRRIKQHFAKNSVLLLRSVYDIKHQLKITAVQRNIEVLNLAALHELNLERVDEQRASRSSASVLRKYRPKIRQYSCRDEGALMVGMNSERLGRNIERLDLKKANQSLFEYRLAFSGKNTLRRLFLTARIR